MNKRLNITIREDLIDQMKKYADLQETCLSTIVEEHFQKLLTPLSHLPKTSLLEFVKALPKLKTDYRRDFDFKKEYYLVKAQEYNGQN